jgi:stage II sporulation protein D
MRTFSKLFVTVLIFCFTPPASAVEVPQAFNFQGTGYGHGVGMSQIGAKARALSGDSASAILNYYYKGVEILPMQDTQILRVNIGHLLSAASIKSGTAGSTVAIYQGDIKDRTDVLPLAMLTSKSGVSLTQLGSQVLPSIVTGKKSQLLTPGKEWTIRWSGTRYMPGLDSTVSLNIAGKSVKYRHGQIQIKSVKAGLLGYKMEITNSVRLHDEYLYGVSEVPSSWPTATLQAQAIASRTYALFKAGQIKYGCDCDLYGGISDQSFAGFSKESEPIYGGLWKAAVNSTAVGDQMGSVITYQGKPISTYFFSSSGGQTETSLNAWGTAQDYTMSVSDPSSLDPVINPRFYTWNKSITQAVIAKAFLLPDVLSLTIASRNETGTVARIIAISSTGVSAELRGETFRSRTALPSAWFTVIN